MRSVIEGSRTTIRVELELRVIMREVVEEGKIEIEIGENANFLLPFENRLFRTRRRREKKIVY